MRPVPYSCYFVYLCLLFSWIITPTARAENYTVENIHTEAVGQTATEARQRAMSEAENKGFFELIKRLSDESTATQLSQTHRANISLMVQSTQINNEKISATSYSADVTLSFSPDQIDALLASKGVTPSVEESGHSAPSILILPVFTHNNETQLLDNQNPWWNAWNNTNMETSGLHFLLPIGDLEDISLTHIQAVRSHDYTQLKPLADKYHANRILIADATYGEDIDTKNPTLNVVAYDVKPEGTTDSSMQFTGASNEPQTALLAKAVNGLIYGLNNNWKTQGQLTTAEIRKTLVKASFSNLQEWQALQRRLSSVETVQKTAVERLAGRYAVIAIYTSSKPEELPQYLQQSGFMYTPSGTMPLIQLVSP